MYVSQVGMMNNAAFNTMQNCDTMMGMTRNAGSATNMQALSKKETNLQVQNLQNQLTYQACDAMEDSQQKMKKDNIKRSFTMFA